MCVCQDEFDNDPLYDNTLFTTHSLYYCQEEFDNDPLCYHQDVRVRVGEQVAAPPVLLLKGRAPRPSPQALVKWYPFTL